MAQPPHPTLVNLPPPGSNPETPSEMPGTPTSTTTSLSALSTTAIKDGHRGHLPPGALGRGHQHSPSATSLEAERADRISRLAGLERVSTLRSPNPAPAPAAALQTTPTAAAHLPPPHHLTPAYFDSNGQPVAVTKISTVGSASATESHVGEPDDARTTAGDRDEDMVSSTDDTNYREPDDGFAHDPMDEDLASRSAGPFDDRMSDDGSASLVGFGEGAGSTVSGPIYHRRPAPHAAWALDRAGPGLTPVAAAAAAAPDTPASAAALQERRDARMVDGVAAPGDSASFVDTTFRGPVAAPRHQGRETAERIVQPLDRGEQRAASAALGSPGRAGDPLGRFYFEGEKKDD